jgi:parallel beta-helix repeat protein
MVRDLEEGKGDRIEDYRVELLLIFIFLFCIVIAIFIFLPQGSEATDVSEPITSDTTWNASGNPYIVKGNVNVNEGVNLTIQPGVILKFDGYYGLHVDGNLAAVGNETDNVTFMKNDLNSSVTSWYGIRIKQEGSAYIYGCEISDGYNGILTDHSSNVTLMNTTIIGSTYGIYFANSLNINISNVKITGSHEGIHLSYSSNILITNTNVSDC